MSFANSRWRVGMVVLASALLPAIQASAETLRLDTETPLGDFPGEVCAVAASPVGPSFVVGWNQSDSAPGGFRAFSADTRQPISQPISLGPTNCSATEFSPDGKHLAVLTSNSRLLIWNTKDWKMVGQGTKRSWDWALASTPDNSEWITCGGHPSIVRWKMATGEYLGEFRTSFKRIVSVRVTPDGKRIVYLGRSGNEFKLVVASFPDFKPLSETPAGQERSVLSRVALSPDGSRFAFATSDGRLWIGPTDDAKQVRQRNSNLTRTHNLVFAKSDRLWSHGWGRSLGVYELSSEAWKMTNAVTSGGKGMVEVSGTHLLAAHSGVGPGSGVSFVKLPSDGAMATTAKSDEPIGAAPAIDQPSIAQSSKPNLIPEKASATLRPPPPTEEISEAEKELAKLLGFKTDEPDSASPTELLRLAAEEDDDIMRYAMLWMAAKSAVHQFNPALAQQAFERLGDEYAIDLPKLAGKLLYASRHRPIASDEKRRMATWAERLGDESVSNEEIVYASAFYEIAIAWSTRDGASLRRLRKKANEVDRLLPAFRAAVSARTRLLKEPQNSAANTTWGSYLCFVRGDWKNGLPYLALSDIQDLKDLAERDLSMNDSPEEMLTLAQQWSQFAAAEPNRPLTSGAVASARYWYKRAIDRLKGVERLRAQAELEKLDTTSELPERRWSELN